MRICIRKLTKCSARSENDNDIDVDGGSRSILREYMARVVYVITELPISYVIFTGLRANLIQAYQSTLKLPRQRFAINVVMRGSRDIAP